MSESTIQLALNGAIIKQFGIKEPIQIVSAILSLTSIYKCIASRYSFIWKGYDTGLFSIDFWKAMVYLFIPIMSLFVFEFLAWSDGFVPSLFPFMILIAMHPIVIGVIEQLFRVPEDKTPVHDMIFNYLGITLGAFYFSTYLFYLVC